MNIEERIDVVVAGNASGAIKAINEVTKETEKASKTTSDIKAKSGKKDADRYFSAYNRAQAGWLRVLENNFRRYGGRVGGIIGDVIKNYTDVSRAMTHTRQVGGQVSGDILGNAAVGGAATGAGAFGGSLLGQKKKPHLVFDGIDDILANKPSKKPTFLSKIGNFIKPLIMFGTVIASVVVSVGALFAAMKKLSNVYKELYDKQVLLTKNQALIDSINAMGSSTERNAEILRRFGEDGFDAYAKLRDEHRKLAQELKNKEGLSEYGAAANASLQAISDKVQEVRDQVASLTGVESFKSGFGSGLLEMGAGGWDILQKGFQKSPVGWVMKKFGYEGATKEDGEDIARGDREVLKRQQLLNDKLKARIAADKEAKELQDDKNKLDKDALNIQNEIVELQNERLTIEQQIDIVNKRQKQLVDEQKKYSKDSIEFKTLEVDKLKNQLTLTELINKREDERNQLIADRNRLADRDKFSISELAGSEEASAAARNAANDIQRLEDQAKIARSYGNTDASESLRNQANQIRNKLGQAGIISANEFGDDFKFENRPRSVAELIKQQMTADGRDFNFQELQAKIKDFHLAQLEKSRNNNPAWKKIAEKQKVKSIDEVYAEKGYFEMKARNAK
jgi:hypothetical protein